MRKAFDEKIENWNTHFHYCIDSLRVPLNIRNRLRGMTIGEYDKVIRSNSKEENGIINEEQLKEIVKKRVWSRYGKTQSENTNRAMEKYIDEFIQKIENGKIANKIGKKEETR